MRRHPAAFWSRARQGLLLLLLLLLSVSGCGFQLQGAARWPAEWPDYRIAYSMRQPGMAEFAGLLDQALQYRGLRPAPSAAFSLQLTSLQDSKLVAAIGGDGKAVEYELRRVIRYQIIAGDWRSVVFSESANRRLSFEPSQVLAKELEETRLRQALSRELIELIILRAEAELRQRSQLEPPAPASGQ